MVMTTPAADLKGRHFLNTTDFTQAEFVELVDRALALKQGRWRPSLAGVVMGMIFFNPSLRTKASLASGVAQLGGTTIELSPGQNTYAQSKEFAERMLRLLVESHPELSATSLRFPMLVTDWLVRRFNMLPKVPSAWIDFEECTAHLFLEDAGRLVADVLDRRLPGYHQYFPAQMMELRGYPLRQLVQDRYSHAELRKPLEGMASLIDVSAITDEVGWVPQQRLSFEVELESAPKSVR